MLGKTLFLYYHDLGSSTSQASYQIATDRMRLHFMQMNGKRSTQNGDSSLEVTYFGAPEGLEKGVILNDLIFLKGDFQIQHAKRKLFGPDGKRIKSESTPSGIFIYNYEDKEDWERNGRKDGMEADEETCATLVEQTDRILSEFRERFGETLKRRVTRVGELYPIDPEKFFNEGYVGGIGPVFAEQFSISGKYACCDPTHPPGSGFQVVVETDRYHLMFDYEKHTPMKGNWGWLAGSFYICHGNNGFKVVFDENFDVRSIQEIGTPNILIDKMYVENDLKDGVGKVLYENVMKIWEEVRKEFSIDERIKVCEGLTAEELSRAEQVVAYMTGKGEFPIIKSPVEAE